MTSPGTFSLGEDIDIHCRYCRLNTNGVVSAMDDTGDIAKVQCRTCRNFQKFKPPVDDSVRKKRLMNKALRMRDKRTSSSPGKSGSGGKGGKELSPEAVARRLWEEATEDANPLKSKIYTPGIQLNVDDTITHREHGLGVVKEVSGKRALVLFREGVKELE